MKRIVCKFGGSSLADVECFQRVRSIIRADGRRRVIVVSAPGKRTPDDRKITDVLLVCQQHAFQGLDFTPVFRHISARFKELVYRLNVPLDIENLLEDTKIRIRNNPYPAFVSSRGEHLTARILSAWLGASYIETRDSIFLHDNGTVNPVTYARLNQVLDRPGICVLPGFYGLNARGRTDTFSRGGSDITGALAARAIDAAVYENWTDVPGVFSADPRIVSAAQPIPELTYAELRELAAMGANVLHDEAVVPLMDSEVPLLIKQTSAPELAGTRVTQRRTNCRAPVGVTARTGFTMVRIELAGMNAMCGIGRRVLEVFESLGCQVHALPTALHALDAIVPTAAWSEVAEEAVRRLRSVLRPDALHVSDDLALVTVVGSGIARRAACAARVCRVLDGARIRRHALLTGSTPHSISVAVDAECRDGAVTALHAGLVESAAQIC